MLVILGLDHRNGEVGLVIENVVRAFGFTPSDHFTPDDDSPLGEAHLPANLRHFIPTRLLNRRGDVFRTNIAFGKVFLAHRSSSVRDR